MLLLLSPSVTCVSIDIDALSTGVTYPAGQFLQNFNSIESQVVSNGVGGKRWLPTGSWPSGTPFWSTTEELRDSCVKTWVYLGWVFLRLSGTPGSQTAIWFKHQADTPPGGNYVSAGVVYNFDETATNMTTAGQYESRYHQTDFVNSDDGIRVGYSRAYRDGDYFEFGVEGNEVYINYNGAEITRFTEIRVMGAGRAMGSYLSFGYYKELEVCPIPMNLYSTDPENGEWDMRDFGCWDRTTTGSITVGTDELVIAEDMGYEVGETVIVEVGDEDVGGGARNTVGVGGVWPTISYADDATLLAATPSVNTWAYAEDTGNVYHYPVGGPWVTGSSAQSINYGRYKNPQALVAVITDVSVDGLTLTLDTDAEATTTDANVYLDVLRCFDEPIYLQRETGSNMDYPYSSSIISIPAGTYAFSDTLSFRRPFCMLQGAGRTETTLISPRGVPCLRIAGQTNANHDAQYLQDMKVVGNHTEEGGFGMHILSTGNPSSQTSGIHLTQCNDAIIRRIDSWNMMGDTFIMHSNNDGLIEDCTHTMEYIQETYSQWALNFVNTTGGICRNVTMVSPGALPAFEMFGSSGVTFTNVGGINTLWSTNSSHSYLWDKCWTIMTEGSSGPFNTDNHFNPIFNINNNAGGTGTQSQLGGTIRDPVIIQLGTSNGTEGYRAIVIGGYNPNVTVEGSYPVCPTDGIYGGYLSSPDGNPSLSYMGQAIVSQGANTIIRNMRVDIGVGPGVAAANISVFSGVPGRDDNSIVENCIANVIINSQDGGTVSGNMTNAEYTTYCAQGNSAIDFPNIPSLNQEYTFTGRINENEYAFDPDEYTWDEADTYSFRDTTWTFNGTGWQRG
jgi:hypothetical protein